MKRDPFAPFRAQYRADDAQSGGPKYWRSIAHKENDASVTDTFGVEFPSGTAPLTAMQRRDVLKLAGASMALATTTACFRRPEDEILPYTHQPEEIIPGIPNHYASVMARGDGAVGILVEAFEGRPQKIEGNPLHPSSLGALDVSAQAEIMRLYDPDRARNPRTGGAETTWAAWDTFATAQFDKLAQGGGQGLAVMVEADDSPSVDRMLAVLQQRFPSARVVTHDVRFADNTVLGAELAFGPGARVHYSLDKAKVVLAADSDFLHSGPEQLKHARDFAKNRLVTSSKTAGEVMNRLYAVEGVFSVTGTNADHRHRLASSQLPAFLRALAAELQGKHGVALGALGGSAAAPAGSEKFVEALAKDLAANKGKAVVLVGEAQPAAVHAFAHAINAGLGAFDAGVASVSQLPGAAARAPLMQQSADLAKAMNDGAVDTLVVIGANPALTWPGALNFKGALAKVKTTIHAGVMVDETAALATWHLPLAHFLEAWSDARGWDGTASIVQPVIYPLFGARGGLELLAQIAGVAADKRDGLGLVKETWASTLADEKAWRRAVHDGVIPGTGRAMGAAPAAAVDAIATAQQALTGAAPTQEALELVVIDGAAHDGRYGNVPWIQELPDAITKLCWDNALYVSPQLARTLGIKSSVVKNRYDADIVELSVDGRTIQAPTFVLPGLAPFTVALARGYGRTAGGVAGGVGVNAYPILGADGATIVAGVKMTRTGAIIDLCSTQDHFAVEGKPFQDVQTLSLASRPLARKGSLKLYQENPTFAHEGNIPENLLGPSGPATHPKKPVQMTPELTFDGQQWGMAIDLTACTGCNACVISCQAENHFAAVGREQVLLGRELHWLRIDRYFTGSVDDPESSHQPIACQHCEQAPCEPVCPVSATVHDDEGINGMAYNRCIGTRYCANNCPYKVRRYNYFDFAVTGNIYRNAEKNARHEIYKLQRNPNVTVRYRGVMEKCSYCTQRVEEAKVAFKRQGGDRKKLPDGAVTPACKQACPTGAITFGNINDPDSAVSKMKLSDRNYEMLQELNIRPRTTFLARLKNTNAELG